MPVETMSKENALLKALPELAAAAKVPANALHVSLGGEHVLSVCVEGKTHAQERAFKRAVEQAITDGHCPDLPTFKIKGHTLKCHAHFIG